MSWNNITVEIEGGTALVTISRPKVLNALNHETLQELDEAMAGLEKNDAVLAIILTGSGEKAFVAGADISFMQTLGPLKAREFARIGQAVFSRIENLTKPVIAAVNGFALGGGCELAMACDIRVASENAKFGQPEVTLGIMAGFGGSQRLPRLVNPGLAKEILFTGDMYDAQSALKMGLVGHVVPSADLIGFCKAMAGRIAASGPVAVRLTKEAVNQGLEMDLEKAFALEADLFGLCFTTSDQKEGVSAFLEKRKAVFKGD